MRRVNVEHTDKAIESKSEEEVKRMESSDLRSVVRLEPGLGTLVVLVWTCHIKP